MTFSELYQAMCDADVAGDHATSSRLAKQIVDLDRKNDAGARNRALLGPDSARDRNRSLVGRARGPLGEAS